MYLQQPSTVAPHGETIQIDTAGSKEYFNITTPFLRDASHAKCPSKAQKRTLKDGSAEFASFSSSFPVFLVLTKTDLLPDDQVTQFSADVEGFIKDNHLEGLWTTTSLVGTGVPELKEDVIRTANGHQLWDPPLQPNHGCKC